MPTGWFIVQPPVTSTAAVALKKVAPALTGGIGYDGSIAPIALSKTRVTMLGYMRPEGPMAVALKKLTVSMNAQQGMSGGLAVTLPKLSTDFEQDLFTGALVSTLKPVKLAFALQTQGEIATRLADVDALLASTQEITGALATGLQYARFILAGAHEQDGALASALKKVELAAVGEVPSPVTPSSTGAGGIDDTYQLNKSLTYAHTVVAGTSQRMYLMAASGHNVWVNPSAFAISATCDGSPVDDDWTLLGSRIDYGNDSGWRLGHIALYEYIAPPAGVWSITVTSSVGSQGIHRMIANSRVYDNVGGTSGMVTQAATSSNAALSLTVTPGDGDYALGVGGFNAAPTFTSPTATPWYGGGSSRNGDLDYWDCRDVPGTGAAVNFTTSNSMKLGGIALVLEKV
jgi:hypothetical protein